MTKLANVVGKNIFSLLLGKEEVNLYHTLDWD